MAEKPRDPLRSINIFPNTEPIATVDNQAPIQPDNQKLDSSIEQSDSNDDTILNNPEPVEHFANETRASNQLPGKENLDCRHDGGDSISSKEQTTDQQIDDETNNTTIATNEHKEQETTQDKLDSPENEVGPDNSKTQEHKQHKPFFSTTKPTKPYLKPNQQTSNNTGESTSSLEDHIDKESLPLSIDSKSPAALPPNATELENNEIPIGPHDDSQHNSIAPQQQASALVQIDINQLPAPIADSQGIAAHVNNGQSSSNPQPTQQNAVDNETSALSINNVDISSKMLISPSARFVISDISPNIRINCAGMVRTMPTFNWFGYHCHISNKTADNTMECMIEIISTYRLQYQLNPHETRSLDDCMYEEILFFRKAIKRGTISLRTYLPRQLRPFNVLNPESKDRQVIRQAPVLMEDLSWLDPPEPPTKPEPEPKALFKMRKIRMPNGQTSDMWTIFKIKHRASVWEHIFETDRHKGTVIIAKQIVDHRLSPRRPDADTPVWVIQHDCPVREREYLGHLQYLIKDHIYNCYVSKCCIVRSMNRLKCNLNRFKNTWNPKPTLLATMRLNNYLREVNFMTRTTERLTASILLKTEAYDKMLQRQEMLEREEMQ